VKADRYEKLLAFLKRLDEAGIHFRMDRYRQDAVSVEITAPGERWEVDFLDDGTVDVERFRSTGQIDDESVLEELFAMWSPDESAAAEPVTQNDTAGQ
jgi:hypothetical protein